VNGRHAPISPRSRSLYNRNLKLPTAFFSPTHAPAKHVAKDWGATKKVFLLFLHHKKEYENPGARFLLQKMERAFASGAKPKPGA
jgi:hypothetical protein